MANMGMILKAVSGLMFAAGILCACAALLAHGGRFSARLDVLTHFAPFWLAGAALVLAYALWPCPPTLRASMAGLGLIGALASVALIAPEILRTPEPEAPATTPNQIKIIQFNTWGRNQDLIGTVRWIENQHADIIVMEECDGPIRELLMAGGHYHISRGMLGVAIFSRAPPSHKPFFLGPPWEDWPGIARATFTAPGGDFSVVGLHLTWPTQSWQKTQRRRVAEMLGRYDKNRLVVIGDFNLTPWSFALLHQDQDWGLRRLDKAMFSWPARPFWRGRIASPVPLLPIDHVYVGADWQMISINRGPRLGSDHFPVVVTLALKP